VRDFAIVYRAYVGEKDNEYAMVMINLLRITILHNFNSPLSVNESTGDRKGVFFKTRQLQV